MNQNVIHTAWSEKIAHAMDTELVDSARKSNPSRRRSYTNSDTELFNNGNSMNDTGLVVNLNLNEEPNFQRRNRSNRFYEAEEVEYEAPSLILKHTPSSDTIYSRGSRNITQSSPPRSFRSIRNATVLSASHKKVGNKDSINIIMLIGFAIGIAFGGILNITDSYLKWLQLKLTELQFHILGGQSIQKFYEQNESVTKKLLFSPLCGLFFILQSFLCVVQVMHEILRKPAPKALVSRIITRYVNE